MVYRQYQHQLAQSNSQKTQDTYFFDCDLSDSVKYNYVGAKFIIHYNNRKIYMDIKMEFIYLMSKQLVSNN